MPSCLVRCCRSWLAVVSVAALLLISARGAGRPVDHVVGRWVHPPTAVPGPGVPDGPLIGNGQLGVALAWTSGRAEIDFHVGHNAFFAAPVSGTSSCGYAPGGRKALGGFTLTFQAGKGAVALAEQMAANGTVVLQLELPTGPLLVSAFVHASENTLLVDVEAPGEVEVTATLWTFSGCSGPPRPPMSADVPVDGRPVTKTTSSNSDRLPSEVTAGPQALRAARANGWPFQRHSFPVKWFSLQAHATGADGASMGFSNTRAMGNCGGNLRGPCARGNWKIQQGHGTLVLQLSQWGLVEKSPTVASPDLHQLRRSHAAAWEDFWERSYIYIPNSPLTMFHWHMSQYLLRISSWLDGAAPGLFGPFVVDDEVSWSGDITLNYNAEAVYYDAAAANHLEAFQPYFQAILDFLPAAERMAAELHPGCDGALYFPAHILPQGVQAAGVGHGDLGQKQIGLFAAVPFVIYWKYSGNLAFAQRSFPFLKGVARFWECSLELMEDGKLHDADDCAEEICLPDGDVQPDPAVVLSLLPAFFEALVQMAEVLGVESQEMQQRWSQIGKLIAPYPMEIVDGQQVIADFHGGESPDGLALRLHSGGSVAWGGLFAAFPLGTVNFQSAPSDMALVHSSLDRFLRQWPAGKQGNSFPHFFAAGARVGWQSEGGLLAIWEAYLANTTDAKCRMYSNGMVLGCGGTGLENVGGAAFASEMLLQVPRGIVHVFPALPPGFAASFRLRAPLGPLLVTAERLASGEVTEIHLQLPLSEWDSGPAVVRPNVAVFSPWPGPHVVVDGKLVDVDSAGVFRVYLAEGMLHVVRKNA